MRLENLRYYCGATLAVVAMACDGEDKSHQNGAGGASGSVGTAGSGEAGGATAGAAAGSGGAASGSGGGTTAGAGGRAGASTGGSGAGGSGSGGDNACCKRDAEGDIACRANGNLPTHAYYCKSCVSIADGCKLYSGGGVPATYCCP